MAALNQKAGEAIATYIRSQGLDADNLDVKYDGTSMTALCTRSPCRAGRQIRRPRRRSSSPRATCRCRQGG
ncbi:MAG: hypothetical protein CBHOC_5168 [uncultured Caballeronia sp.]|nr:MAG: hypothetical protein CBHOC_5168 [uncultured Caballeronia sp.]